MKYAIAAVILVLAGCTEQDQAHAQRKAEKAKVEIKHDLHEAGREIKKGVNEIKHEIHDSHGSEPRRRSDQ